LILVVIYFLTSSFVEFISGCFIFNTVLIDKHSHVENFSHLSILGYFFANALDIRRITWVLSSSRFSPCTWLKGGSTCQQNWKKIRTTINLNYNIHINLNHVKNFMIMFLIKINSVKMTLVIVIERKSIRKRLHR